MATPNIEIHPPSPSDSEYDSRSSNYMPFPQGTPSYVNSLQESQSISPNRKDNKQDWPFTSNGFRPEIDDGATAQYHLNEKFGQNLFAEETAIEVTKFPEDVHEPTICDDHKVAQLLELQEPPKFILYYVKMNTREKLEISRDLFKKLAKHYDFPVSFVSSILQYQHLPLHYGSRLHSLNGQSTYDFWYILRTRISFGCTHSDEECQQSEAGGNQMNPFHPLHLRDRRCDIRPCELGMFLQYNLETKQTTVVVVNFHYRSELVVKEPQRRLDYMMQFGDKISMEKDPWWVYMLYLGTILQWWKIALTDFGKGLIEHEKQIEQQMTAQVEDSKAREIISPHGLIAENSGSSTINKPNKVQITKALHAMNAHCLRYETELTATMSLIEELISEHQELTSSGDLNLTPQECNRTRRALKQQLAEASSIYRMQSELAKKIQNTLGLLYHSVQAEHELRQVKILELSYKDAGYTYELTKQTAEDGYVMKTIAIMTMFFLPGTAFSALLALPYFGVDERKGSTIWIWAILTGVCTMAIMILFGRAIYKSRTSKFEPLKEYRELVPEKVSDELHGVHVA